MKIKRMLRLARRADGTFTWIMEEPELLSYSIGVADLWLNREYNRKGFTTGNLLNKACGILAEEVFNAELTEFNIPHLRTLPLLDKEHPANIGKNYDFKIEGCTIDVKAIPPFSHHKNLNVNQAEINKCGACDLYIAAKCYPELLEQHIKNKESAKAILIIINSIEFLGYAEADELIKSEHLKSDVKRPYYSLSKLRSMDDFASRFNIDLKQLKLSSD